MTKTIFSVLGTVTVFVGLALLFQTIITHKPQHKVGELFEFWSAGNEFQKPELISFGQIDEVGKKDYKLGMLTCTSVKLNSAGFFSVSNIEFFDKHFKIVDITHLTEDVRKACGVE